MAMTLRLTEQQDATLTRLAEMSGISKQQAAALAIEEAMENRSRDAKFEAAYERLIKRHSGLLDDLSKT
jgi:hypothetical protein